MTDVAKQRLHAHHGGAQFHDVMLRTFERRFSSEFWDFWRAHVVPHHRQADAPAYADFGCGPGLMLPKWRERWPKAELHGVELQEYMLQTARDNAEQARATLHDADLHAPQLPIADGSLDAVLSAVVIHEMREPVGMLREVHRVLAPGGRLMLMDWIRVPLTQYLADASTDPFDPATSPEARGDKFDHFMEHNKFSAEDLRFILAKCGFTVREVAIRPGGQFVWLTAETQTPAGA